MYGTLFCLLTEFVASKDAHKLKIAPNVKGIECSLIRVRI